MANRIRFGVFEMDLRLQELYKSGRPVRLQEQPYRILEVLLRRPGETVTREEFRREIWDEDVYVDFDRSLNTGIARLREALGDSPTRPIYIETVPRKGYRFIAPIQPSEGTPPDGKHARGDAAHRSQQLGRRGSLLITALLLAAGFAWLYWRVSVPVDSQTPPGPQRLTSYLGAEDEPTFSPDGSQFAFTWNGEARDNFDIYVRTVGPGQERRLTRHRNRDSSPAWSPDGQWIAFERPRDDGRISILRISPFGGREEELLVLPGRRGYPGLRRLTWSPDSQHLVIGTRREGEVMDWSLVLYGVRERSQRDLVGRGLHPSFSPTGRFLAFERFAKGCYVLALSDSLQPLAETKVNLGDSCGSPVWTSDGRRLVVEARFRGSPSGLWSARPDGSDAKPLYVTGSDLRPAIGPAGRLAFRQEMTRIAIRRLDLESGHVVTLIASSGRNLDPVYSPDGEKILFRSDRGPMGLWIASADGSNPALLVEGGADGRWSPDGSKIAFRALEPGDPSNSGPHDIWVIGAEGGPATNLTNSPSRDVAPSWSRDGAWIYFTSDRDGAQRLWKIQPTGGEAHLVLDGPFAGAREAPGGRRLYVTSGRTLFRTSLNETPELLIPELGGWSAFAIGPDGLYYATVDHGDGSEIRFLSTIGHSDSLIYKMTDRSGSGMDISPGRRHLLFTEIEAEESDLMLLEGAR